MRISCTTLESYRLWREGDWMPEADLIATIRGEFTPNHAINLGQAYGRVIEDPARYLVPGGYRVMANGEVFEFDHATMQPALDVVDRRGFFEVKAIKPYGDHVVVAKADHVIGLELNEFKTTCSSYDADKYMDSYQWRFMVDIFRPAVVTYHTFCLSEDVAGVVSLRSVESLSVYPYPSLHEDCAALVRDFVDHVRMKGLEGYLTPSDALAGVR